MIMISDLRAVLPWRPAISQSNSKNVRYREIVKMKVKHLFAACGLAAAFGLCAGPLSAQNTTPPAPAPGAPAPGDTNRRGNFDPAQFQQRILDNVKEKLGFSDADWSAVQPLVVKVIETGREAMAGRMSMGRLGRSRSSDSNRGGGDQANRPSGNRPSFFGTPSPEAEALQKALDDKAPAGQVKAALDKFHESKKDKEAKLAAAQEDLRKVLTATQEAQATLLGLLP